jgi:hypothetical protein
MSVKSKFTVLFTKPTYAQPIWTHITQQFFAYSHVFQRNSANFREIADQYLKLTKLYYITVAVYIAS